MRHRGFTLLEVMIAVTILAIMATLGLDMIADNDAAMRAERAARECVAAIRAARTLAITTGANAGVEFNVGQKKFHVYGANTPGTPVSNSLCAGGTYIVSLTTNRELSGVTMQVALNGVSTDPGDLQFTPRGATANDGSVTFTYGGRTRVVTIPIVGDPTMN